MNFLWILPFCLALNSAVRHTAMECFDKGRGKLKFYTTGNGDPINNIFSTDPEHNCSVSNNDFIGNGTKDFPYEISVDISPSRKTYKPCGGKMVNATRWKVEFVTKSFEDFFGSKDQVESLNCPIDRSKDNHIAIGSFHLQHIRGKPNIGPMTMSLVSTDSEEIPAGQLVVGQKVKLQIEIPENSEAQRGRVTFCYVKDPLHDNYTSTFYNTKCSFSGYPVPVKFLTDETNHKLIESTEFHAFRLHDNGKVQFTCYVEVCVKGRDPYCLDTDCVQLGTFLHPYKQVKSLAYSLIEVTGANSGVNKLMSFTLIPIVAVMITFTKINWF